MILHGLDHLFTLREIAGDVIGALRGLQFELADQLLGVLANQVERHAEPLVDRSIQQTIGKDEKEDDRDQREAEEGHHHFRLEARTQLLLLPLDVELQQNAQEDEGKDDEGQENDGGENQQQDRFFRITGADEVQVQ